MRESKSYRPTLERLTEQTNGNEKSIILRALIEALKIDGKDAAIFEENR